MCGIIGYAGCGDVCGEILKGLKRLEYRGYDSCGIAVGNKRGISVLKTKGRVEDLERLLSLEGLPNTATGIGHTRWATHGKPDDINAHPHLSQGGRIAIVHNGIIENGGDLKEFLTGAGFRFRSETDSEVIAHLIEYYQREDFDFTNAVKKTVKRLHGSYAIAVVCADAEGVIYVTRRGSPLVIGCGNGKNLIASDACAMSGLADSFIFLNDGELALVSRDFVTLYDAEGNGIVRDGTVIEFNGCGIEKDGYPHFMLKEIHEQPEGVRRTLDRYLQGQTIVRNPMLDKFLIGVGSIKIAACGSAYNAGLAARDFIEMITGLPVGVELASEARYSRLSVRRDCLTVAVSQSGETADTLAALRKAKGDGGRVIAVVNAANSTIAKEAHYAALTDAGPEIAVATTKGYTTQCAALYALALRIAILNNSSAAQKTDINTKTRLAGSECGGKLCLDGYFSEIHGLPIKLSEFFLSGEVEKTVELAERYYESKSIFFIGRKCDWAAALEGCLKLKEISYIHADAYAAGELKHGPISLIEVNTPVIAVACEPDTAVKTLSNMIEAKSRGASVSVITNNSSKKVFLREGFDIITVPDTVPEFSPVLSAVAMQLFAYHVSVLRGCDVDKPRNLAKSVTVE